MYLTINIYNKNLIGYTVFDKVKVIYICANIVYYETTKPLQNIIYIETERVYIMILMDVKYIPTMGMNIISCVCFEKIGCCYVRRSYKVKFFKDRSCINMEVYRWSMLHHIRKRLFEEVWICFLRTKDETFKKFKEWKMKVTTHTSKKLKILRTENGLEYCNKKFDSL